MKTRFLLVPVVLCLLIAGCDDVSPVEEPASADLFEVHLSSSFNDVPVSVEIDGREIFRGRLTNEIQTDSGPEVSPFDLAGVVSADLSVGEHRLVVNVFDSAREELTFTIEDTLAIIVSYRADTNDLQFVLMNEVPLYL